MFFSPLIAVDSIAVTDTATATVVAVATAFTVSVSTATAETWEKWMRGCDEMCDEKEVLEDVMRGYIAATAET